MTLQATAPISLGDVLVEIRLVNPGRTLPINLGDSDVRALAGLPSGAISLSDLLGKSSYIPMSVISTAGFDSRDSTPGAGTAVCNPSVAVSYGDTPYTYLWSFTSNPDGATLSNATSAACSVSHNYASHASGSAHAVLQCVITDATAHTITATGIGASLDWST